MRLKKNFWKVKKDNPGTHTDIGIALVPTLLIHEKLGNILKKILPHL